MLRRGPIQADADPKNQGSPDETGMKLGSKRSNFVEPFHEVKHESCTHPQFTRLPVRLAFCLKDAVPMSAIEAGHVFLGFSKCGQFLLSYTQVSPNQGLHLSRLAPPEL